MLVVSLLDMLRWYQIDGTYFAWYPSLAALHIFKVLNSWTRSCRRRSNHIARTLIMDDEVS